MPNQKNQDQLQVIKDKLTQSKSVMVIDYSGIDVADQTELRAALKEAGGEMLVTKNTLIDLAVGKGKLAESLTGMNALILSYDDEVGAIKATFKFHNETDKLQVKQGLVEDRILSFEELESLSQIPGRQELMATLISRIQGPAHGLVSTLRGTQRNLVYVLTAISKKEN